MRIRMPSNYLVEVHTIMNIHVLVVFFTDQLLPTRTVLVLPTHTPQQSPTGGDGDTDANDGSETSSTATVVIGSIAAAVTAASGGVTLVIVLCIITYLKRKRRTQKVAAKGHDTINQHPFLGSYVISYALFQLYPLPNR